jgi:hypothetical protein
MSELRTEQVTGSDNWDLSVKEIEERVKEYYQPSDPGEERWFQCQRSVDDGTVCGQKVFFPHGVVAHENHHSIESGDGPIISQDQPDDPVSEEFEEPDYDPAEDEEQILESIQSEFKNPD